MTEKKKSARGGKRPGAGRPAIEVVDTREAPARVTVDLKTVELLGRMGCTQEDMACEFGISERAFKYLLNKHPALREVVDYSGARGKTSLRLMIWKKAKAGDVASIIFLNKAMNGMSDRVAHELTGRDGKPIETKDVSGSHTKVVEDVLKQMEVAKIALATPKEV